MADDTNTADEAPDSAPEGAGGEQKAKETNQESTFLDQEGEPGGESDEGEAEGTQDTEDKGDNADDSEGGDGDAEPKLSADDLTMPEGMEVDEAALGQFLEVAATMNDGQGLSKEDAQKVVDMRVAMVKAQTEAWDTTFSEWRGEIMSDTELGGDNFIEQTVPNVLAAVERYGSKEMGQLIRTNRMYGENPHLVRMLNNIGKTLREDSTVRGTQRASTRSEDSKLNALFPTHQKEE